MTSSRPKKTAVEKFAGVGRKLSALFQPGGTQESATLIPFPQSRAREHELAFLPAALEIIETPPSPVGRAVAGTIIAFFTLALAWACIGQVDIIASAPGKIIPSGRTKIIQPFEIGVVRAIHVQDGQSVKAGDVLVELDPTTSVAEREHLQSDLIGAQLDIARLRAALSDAADPVAEFHPPDGASAALVAMHKQYLINQLGEQNAKLAALDHQQGEKEAERNTALATIAKLEATIPLLQQRVEVRKYLTDREYGSKLTYLETLQDLREHEHDLEVQKSHLKETEAALAEVAQNRAETAAESKRTLYNDLAAAEQKAAGLTQDLVKADERTKLQLLTSPVDGVVQQVQVTTIGGVVTPAQQLMVIVPADSKLEVEAMVQNRDIGFVEPGQPAEIKVDTFNFTKYGLLHGKVTTLSQDAIARDRPAEKDKAIAQPETSQPPGQELVYAARIALDKTTMQVEDKTVNLSPGMAVTVEIKTGQRRLIDYILSPIMRYRQEGMRER